MPADDTLPHHSGIATMLEQSDFIRILLLLTTALGLSFTIERVLELLNGLLKKLLYSELSPFSDNDALQEPDLYEAEIAAIDTTLDRDAEAIGRLVFEINRSEADVAELEALLAEKRAAFDRLIETLRQRVREIRGAHDEPITGKHEERLAALQRRLDAYQVRNELHGSLELEENYPEALFVLEPIPPRPPVETAQAFWLQSIGAFAGVAVCYFSHFGLFQGIGIFGDIAPVTDAILSGILIGGGSQPIHVLMKFLNERSVVDMKPVRQEDLVITPAAVAGPPLDPPTRSAPHASLDIPYDGGVDRDTLDPGRRRLANPDLIVYHHTAMHSDAAFEDVVRVIKGRGWSTGYHCVVTYDGAIHPFCRWDYVGNHAFGVNDRSLGIALNGNFHTTPGDSGANDRGQYGHACPADDQLFNAARVVALWCHLYGIPVEFGRTIVSHRQIRATACAGSNFPDRIFEQLVRGFYEQWRTPAAQAELDLYRRKQFLFPA
ncbi:MAG: N-acetylmuramoyl-L-alanine amidase [Rhodothermales bacterium]